MYLSVMRLVQILGELGKDLLSFEFLNNEKLGELYTVFHTASIIQHLVLN